MSHLDGIINLKLFASDEPRLLPFEKSRYQPVHQRRAGQDVRLSSQTRQPRDARRQPGLPLLDRNDRQREEDEARPFE